MVGFDIVITSLILSSLNKLLPTPVINELMVIPAGLHLRARTKLLDWSMNVTLDVHLAFGLPLHFKFDFETDPVSLGRVLQFKRRRGSDLGPKFYAEVGLLGFGAYIEGYVEVLGIGAYTVVKIDYTDIIFSVEGSLFGLIEARVTVAATDYLSLHEARFLAHVEINFARIELSTAIRRLTRGIVSRLKSARRKLRHYRHKLRVARARLITKKIGTASKSYSLALMKYQYLQGKCRDGDCSILDKLTLWHRKNRVGHYRRSIARVKQEMTLEQVALRVYMGHVEAAESALHGLEAFIGGSGSVLANIAEAGLESIQIRRIWSTFEIGVKNGPEFDAGVLVDVFGKQKKLNVRINLKDLTKSASRIARKMFPKVQYHKRIST